VTTKKPKPGDPFVEWFRASSPYIHAHRGRTFVIVFGGEAVQDSNFPNTIHDIALLHGLGVRLVLVHGTRPQIEERLRAREARLQVINGLRVTDDTALECVKEAAAIVRVEIEALLSMGIANSPMAGARIRVASGNFVTARPLGVRDGVDYCHTGLVRRIDAEGIAQRLGSGAVVLLSAIGYSPTGEVFNLTAEDVATSTAIALKADKLISLVEGPGLKGPRSGIVSQLTPRQADAVLESRRRLAEDVEQHLRGAAEACRQGVRRAHLIGRAIDGALLRELFTRDGIGTLVTAEAFEEIRTATIDDVGGILELIQPLEQKGVLVRRSRERLEMEIARFMVVERDGTVIACAALYPYDQEHLAELACLAVLPEYRNSGRGDGLLNHVENTAKTMGVTRLFVLTTQTTHWFRERGFAPTDIDALPVSRRELYNYRRNSKILIKDLSADG